MSWAFSQSTLVAASTNNKFLSWADDGLMFRGMLFKCVGGVLIANYVVICKLTFASMVLLSSFCSFALGSCQVFSFNSLCISVLSARSHQQCMHLMHVRQCPLSVVADLAVYETDHGQRYLCMFRVTIVRKAIRDAARGDGFAHLHTQQCSTHRPVVIYEQFSAHIWY